MRNRGVEAIVVPTIEGLRHNDPDIEIDILTRTPDYDELRLQPYDINLHLESRHLNRQSPPVSRKKKLLSQVFPLYKLPTVKPTPNSPILCKAKAVIASGGDIFSPEYSITPHLKPLKLALEAGKSIMFLAQSISPYRTDEEAESWLEVARQAKLITVREMATYKYVTEELGLSTDLVKLTADPAFLLNPASDETINNLLKSYGIPEGRPLVAISTSQGICSYASIWDQRKHITAWEKVVKTILEELDADVIIIPHVQEVKASNDDRIIASQLLRSLDYNPQVHVAGADHSASEFKGLIGKCDLVIAERMHAAIAGLSSGVCTLAVGYSIKAQGIMADLVGEENLQGGLLISIEDFLEPELACQSVHNAWKQRDEIKKTIQEQLPEVKQKALRNFDLIFQAMTN